MLTSIEQQQVDALYANLPHNEVETLRNDLVHNFISSDNLTALNKHDQTLTREDIQRVMDGEAVPDTVYNVFIEEVRNLIPGSHQLTNEQLIYFASKLNIRDAKFEGIIGSLDSFIQQEAGFNGGTQADIAANNPDAKGNSYGVGVTQGDKDLNR